MNKNKFSIADTIRFLAGCFLVAAGFIVMGIPRSISGSMIGIGAALIALSATKYLLTGYYHDHPSEERKSLIEDKDERTIQIREKSKARAFDVIAAIFPILFVLLIISSAEIWLTLIVVMVYAIGYATHFYWLGKYQKMM
jgi:hypothetical protein